MELSSSRHPVEDACEASGGTVTDGIARTVFSHSLLLGVDRDSGKGSRDLTAELVSTAQSEEPAKEIALVFSGILLHGRQSRREHCPYGAGRDSFRDEVSLQVLSS